MTKKFDKFILPLLEDMAVASVLGNDGAYDTSDVRTPKVIMPMMRRKMRKKRRK